MNKPEKQSNISPVASTRLNPKLFAEIREWCLKRGITRAQAYRECIELGFMVYTEK